jgi:hypothetical protein
MRNDIEDTRDHLDRIDEDIDKKITSKQEVLRLRNKIKNLEESVNINKLKCLDVEDSILGIEKSIIHLKNSLNSRLHHSECNEEIKINIKNMTDSIKLLNDKINKNDEEYIKNKKLKSDISNTKFSIKKLLIKEKNNNIIAIGGYDKDFNHNIVEE